MDGFFKDLRFTVRNMGRSPGLAVVIAVSLALGIGANTAIFSLIRAVMLKSLPVQDPDRLVLLHWYGEAWPRGLSQSGSGGPPKPQYKKAPPTPPVPLFPPGSQQRRLFERAVPVAPPGRARPRHTPPG